jgi:hypothetical protein
MKHLTHCLRLAIFFSLLLLPLAVRGQQPSVSPSPVTAIAAARPLSELLPDRLAGLGATSEVHLVTFDQLGEIVVDKANAYKEYRVSTAASREYAGIRIDLFQTRNQFAAFGLFTYSSGTSGAKPAGEGIGWGSALVNGAVLFWKDSYFGRLNPSNHGRGGTTHAVALARAVANAIVPRAEAATRPALLESLPTSQMIAGSEQYFLGPESLGAYVNRGNEMFEFQGDAEAVLAEYNQSPAAGSLSQAAATGAGRDKADNAQGISRTKSAAEQPLKLVVVEYHTPQFATDGMVRLNSFVESLPEEERDRIIFQREGNYMIGAVNVVDRELAQGLISSIKYPYTVKWLRNPLWPTNDPFRMEKTAQMLLSTFGLLGLILLTVLTIGSAVGAAIFLKRRKRQQEIFSDAGGMLRLDIDPFESTLLGLPPKRSEE